MPRHIPELFVCAGAKIQNRLEKSANNNKEYGQKVATSVYAFLFHRHIYFSGQRLPYGNCRERSFLVWKLLFKRNIPTNGSVKLTGTIWKSWYRMSGKVLPIFAGLRRLQVLSKCGFPKALLNLCKFACRRPFGSMVD